MVQCKNKLVNYLENNSEKFDSYLAKSTEFDDIQSYLQLLKTKNVDFVLEFMCLLTAYHRNLKILYNSGSSLKEKIISYQSKNISDDTSAKLQSEDNDEYLMIFVVGNELIPLLPEENDDSDASSDKSTELVTESLKDESHIPKDEQHSEDDIGQQNLFQRMSKFVDNELEAKLSLDDDKLHQPFENPDVEDDEAPLFSEIWKRPSESDSDKNLHIPKETEKHNKEFSSKAPPGLVKDSNNISKLPRAKK